MKNWADVEISKLQDLFSEKISRSPLTICFPEYKVVEIVSFHDQIERFMIRLSFTCHIKMLMSKLLRYGVDSFLDFKIWL